MLSLNHAQADHLQKPGHPHSPKLIGSFLVDPVSVTLVDVDQEDQVIPEHAEAVQPGHLDDKGKQVIDDGVQELVGHLAPGQGSHTLQLVVDVQLHEEEDSGHL